jgi:hypothetical protein
MRAGAAWAKLIGSGLMMAVLGCRTPKPDLKPASTVEALNSPPAEKRFDSPAYPKEAFNNRDAIRKLNQDQGDVLPVRGPGSPMSPTGFR